jgi:hypothetical protein
MRHGFVLCALSGAGANLEICYVDAALPLQPLLHIPPRNVNSKYTSALANGRIRRQRTKTEKQNKKEIHALYRSVTTKRLDRIIGQLKKREQCQL